LSRISASGGNLAVANVSVGSISVDFEPSTLGKRRVPLRAFVGAPILRSVAQSGLVHFPSHVCDQKPRHLTSPTYQGRAASPKASNANSTFADLRQRRAHLGVDLGDARRRNSQPASLVPNRLMVGDLGERRSDFCVDLGNGVRVEMRQPLRRPRRHRQHHGPDATMFLRG
jgi:hypothetical protein